MTDTVLISLITSITACITACVAAYFAYKGKNMATKTHDIVNSRMTELLSLTRASSRAEGKLEGQAESRTPNGPVEISTN